MPWCEGCSRFLNPNTLQPDGSCPTCGRHVADPEEMTDAPPPKVPWHFKLLVAITVIYVGFRVVQMISWVVT
jgi:hypothetical protein